MKKTMQFGRGVAGRSIIEIMVSLLIAAVVLGAVLVTISGTGLSGRRSDAQARLSDDGQVAMSLLLSQMRMASYWFPSDPTESLDPDESMLFGCDNGFSNPNVAAFDSLACAAAALPGNGVAVRFDATEQPGVAVQDCLGNDVAGGARVDNRYYVDVNPQTGNPTLYCRGNGGGGPQPLIDNVETMVVTYGIGSVSTATPPDPFIFANSAYTGNTERYVSASDLAACPPGAPVANSWCAVTAVRICLVLRTEDNAADEANTPYVGCDGQVTSVNDRRIRRAMTSTINLRNRTAFVTE